MSQTENAVARARQIVSDLMRDGIEEAIKGGWAPEPAAMTEDNAKSLIRASLEKMVPRLADMGLF